MKISIKKTKETAILPIHGTMYSAGYDLCASLDQGVVIFPGETKFISTGLSVAIPEGYFGGIFARSGLSCKNGLRPANCVGVIDSDYRGEIMVALHNDGGKPFTVEPGMKIAQFIVLPYLSIEFDEVNELPDTERGEGGFGSTGV